VLLKPLINAYYYFPIQPAYAYTALLHFNNWSLLLYGMLINGISIQYFFLAQREGARYIKIQIQTQNTLIQHETPHSHQLHSILVLALLQLHKSYRLLLYAQPLIHGVQLAWALQMSIGWSSHHIFHCC